MLLYLIGVGQDNPALLKPGLCVVPSSLQLLLTVPQRHDAGRGTHVNSLVSMAS